MNNVTKAKEKPVLDQESFQQLLAAAYLLQLHNDRLLSIRPIQPVGASPASSFAAGAIVQKRTPSLMNRERHPHRMKVLSRPMLWRTVEAFAIAIVFCMMMGLSIHRLSAVPGHTSLASGMLEEQSGFQPTRPSDKALASSQAVVAPNSSQSPIGGEADIVAENIVIRPQTLGVNVLGRPGARLTSGRDAVFDTVVEYGPDVTMWSRKSERATPNRLGH